MDCTVLGKKQGDKTSRRQWKVAKKMLILKPLQGPATCFSNVTDWEIECASGSSHVLVNFRNKGQMATVCHDSGTLHGMTVTVEIDTNAT